MDVMVRLTADRDEVVSLAIYNEVWPRAAVTMDEVDSYKAGSVAYADYLALLDGEPVGSGVHSGPQRGLLPDGHV